MVQILGPLSGIDYGNLEYKTNIDLEDSSQYETKHAYKPLRLRVTLITYNDYHNTFKTVVQ